MINMALVERRLQGLRSDPRISSLVVKGKSTGKHLGTGSFGSVEEIDVDGVICAGKKIHEILLEAENEGAENMVEMFVRECQLMSGLRHPNITQFLGLCFLPNCQLPILVMEKLNGSLDCLLESSPGIPLALKLSVLQDIAKGLLYLHRHNPQIIHRDLTARNVLLTSSLVAKITDFGNSRFVNFQSGKVAKTLTRYPGTLDYMPPEARKKIARYGPSLDIFSFGHLALFVGLQEFPSDMLESTYEDPRNPEVTLGRSEVERRSIYFGKLERQLLTGKAQPLIQLIKQCLMNNPSRRPTTEQLLTTLERIRADMESLEGDLAITRAEAVRLVITLWERDIEVKEKTKELKVRDTEIKQLQQEVECANISNQELQIEVQQYNAEITTLQRELQVKHQLQEEHCRALRQKDEQLTQKDKFIQQISTDLNEASSMLITKDEEIIQLQQKLEIEATKKELEIAHNKDLRQREVKVDKLQQQLHQLNSELKRKSDLITKLEEQLHLFQVSSKSRTVSGLQRRNVLLLGKTGGGKSTLGNKLIDTANILAGDLFIVSSEVLRSVTTHPSACTTLLTDDNNHYRVQVIDTVGLFDTRSREISRYTIMKDLSAFIKEKVPNGLSLVLFVVKYGRWTKEEEDTFAFFTKHFSDELSSISALIITGCENYTDMNRRDIIVEFIERQPAIAEFMKKGIHLVGFPDTSQLPPTFRSMLEEGIKSDQEHLRQLVYSCNEMKQIVKDDKCKIS